MKPKSRKSKRQNKSKILSSFCGSKSKRRYRAPKSKVMSLSFDHTPIHAAPCIFPELLGIHNFGVHTFGARSTHFVQQQHPVNKTNLLAKSLSRYCLLSPSFSWGALLLECVLYMCLLLLFYYFCGVCARQLNFQTFPDSEKKRQ